MLPYSKFQPTGFDPKGLGLPDKQDWLVIECAHNRDSGPLAKSNWESLEKQLDMIDPDGADHEACSFGHWANGWFEVMLVRPNSACATTGEEIESALSDYPVLDEDDYSAKTFEAACEAWECTDTRERIKILARHKCSIFAARRDEIPSGLPYYDDFYREEN